MRLHLIIIWNKTVLEEFLKKNWHIRLSFIREWGKFSGFKIPDYKDKLETPNSPVVAVTIARINLFAVIF